MNLSYLRIAFVALAIGMSAPSHAEDFPVATGDYPPYTSPSLDGGGVVNALVGRLAEQADLDPDFEFLPWRRALELARAGRYAATSFWYFNENRNSDFIHVGPVMQDRLVFFYRADRPAPTWTTLPDLAGLKIGAVSGYTFTEEFWALGDAGVLDIHMSPTDTTNFRKLLAGRIDLYPMSEESGWTLIDTVFGPDQRHLFATVERPLVVTEGYLLVSRAWPNADDLAARLSAGLDAPSATDPLTESVAATQ